MSRWSTYLTVAASVGKALASSGHTPFSEYLETPLELVVFGAQYGDRLGAAESDRVGALRAMAKEIIEVIVLPRPDVRTTRADLVFNGFDPSTPEPDPN